MVLVLFASLPLLCSVEPFVPIVGPAKNPEFLLKEREKERERERERERKKQWINKANLTVNVVTQKTSTGCIATPLQFSHTDLEW